MRKGASLTLLLGGGALILTLVITICTPTLANLWSLLTDHREFRIPMESSILTFHVTEMNSGSGQWWISGEDARYCYVYSESAEFHYFAFPKSNVNDCFGFDPRTLATWCPRYTITHRAR